MKIKDSKGRKQLKTSVMVVKHILRNKEKDELNSEYSGEIPAFEKIYQQYKDVIFTYLLHQVSDRNIADDLFQDVMIKIFRNLKNYKPTGSIKAWIIVIARNRLKDYHRNKLRRRRFFIFSDPKKAENGEISSINTISYENPDRDMENIELSHQINKAILQLPAEQREVIDLHYNFHLSFREVSEILNCSINTAASRVRYALKKLKELLEV
jgi:RNA polymerase sigma-70 factor (ECF subfamily)